MMFVLAITFLFWTDYTVDSINDYVQKNCSGSYENLMLSVNTSINSFNIPFNEKVIEYLEVSGTNKWFNQHK